ncbi:hypothetical protein [Limnohabitans sp. Jir72]|uniref:hypothetical protein n=1 Tax=Limnohabitans sp. Jir72 TaxID=1977909 RepID=UPI000D36731F|nr:hypothetical protein [Limnohabitans sp. Jir72]PUE27973.1 hypothetical protein B9Z52_14975 [Limnohabitans sp. Jir72]
MSKQSITNIAAQQFANDTVQKLDALFKTRENWEATDFKKSNEGLYCLLGECLGVFNATFIKVTDDQRRALRSELTSKLSAAGVKVQKNTTSLMMLVRFVFNSDRKRAHGYATVLAAAIADGVSPTDLPAYILAAGGVEEIKRRQVKSAEAIAKHQKIEDAKANVMLEVELAAATTPLATVQIEDVTGTFALLLVKPSLNGSAAVVGVLSELPESMVKALITRMAKVRVSEQQQADLTNTADKDILAAAIKASNDDQMLNAA